MNQSINFQFLIENTLFDKLNDEGKKKVFQIISPIDIFSFSYEINADYIFIFISCDFFYVNCDRILEIFKDRMKFVFILLTPPITRNNYSFTIFDGEISFKVEKIKSFKKLYKIDILDNRNKNFEIFSNYQFKNIQCIGGKIIYHSKENGIRLFNTIYKRQNIVFNILFTSFYIFQTSIYSKFEDILNLLELIKSYFISQLKFELISQKYESIKFASKLQERKVLKEFLLLLNLYLHKFGNKINEIKNLENLLIDYNIIFSFSTDHLKYLIKLSIQENYLREEENKLILNENKIRSQIENHNLLKSIFDRLLDETYEKKHQ